MIFCVLLAWSVLVGSGDFSYGHMRLYGSFGLAVFVRVRSCQMSDGFHHSGNNGRSNDAVHLVR